MNNSDRAWAKVGSLKGRASVFGGIAISALILGALILFIAMGTAVGVSSSAAAGAQVWMGIAVLLLAIANTFAIGWVFARSMSDHAEVVYFSSGTNAERTIETELIPTQVLVNEEVVRRCPNCRGIVNEGEAKCKFCGQNLTK